MSSQSPWKNFVSHTWDPFSPWVLVSNMQQLNFCIPVNSILCRSPSCSNWSQTVSVNMYILHCFFHIYIYTHISFSPKHWTACRHACVFSFEKIHNSWMSGESEWAKSQPFVAYKFLIVQWKATNIWCKLQMPETIADLYLIYLLSMWTWAFTSACALYGERKRSRRDLPVTVDVHSQAFPNLFWNSNVFFLWQFVSVYNSRSLHLDVGNMVATSIILMFHGQLLSSLAYFN